MLCFCAEVGLVESLVRIYVFVCIDATDNGDPVLYPTFYKSSCVSRLASLEDLMGIILPNAEDPAEKFYRRVQNSTGRFNWVEIRKGTELRNGEVVAFKMRSQSHITQIVNVASIPLNKRTSFGQVHEACLFAGFVARRLSVSACFV
jgi:hypothetical protein